MNCGGKLINFEVPLVMGILNITPDSFYDGGKFVEHNTVTDQVKAMLADGAEIIDIGGYSSRPNAGDVLQEEEINRVVPVIELLVNKFPDIIISIDTFRSEVARAAVNAGAAMINDISGGNLDKNMFKTVADLKMPYILMHMQGVPKTMQNSPSYNNVVKEIISFFSSRIEMLKKLGVNDIILDPGVGFGKNTVHNYVILNNLDDFKIFNLPILVGVSRKSLINKVLHTQPEHALNGTTVINTFSLMNSANILRVHDVKEAKETITIMDFSNKVKQHVD
ncbi:MAG: dihydropteroate synthase [Flavobacteriales bacterium]|nr:dihydropteroate synthase [Flavobacteriales bacterium]